MRAGPRTGAECRNRCDTIGAQETRTGGDAGRAVPAPACRGSAASTGTGSSNQVAVHRRLAPETPLAVVRRHRRRSVRCAFLGGVSSRLRRRVGRACSDSSAHPRRSRAPRADYGVCRKPDVLDGGLPTERHGLEVVVLEAAPAVAPLARLELPLAASARAPPDLALHRRRDGLPLLLARKPLTARAGLLQRLLDQTLPLRSARTRSRPRSRISAAVPSGQAWPRASFAASSFQSSRRVTVTCRRASSASRNSTDSSGGSDARAGGAVRETGSCA
jgi:hypothetical protein